MLNKEQKLQKLKNKINNKDQEIKRLLKTLNYSNKDKYIILDSLDAYPLNLSLREDVLKLFKARIKEENDSQGKRKFKKF